MSIDEPRQERTDSLEHERAEQALRESRAQLEAVFQQLPAGVVIAEAPSGRILGSNAQAERILGHPMLPAPDFQGYRQYGALRPDGTLLRPDEHPLARALLHGEQISQEELRYRRGDGRIIWIAANAAPIRDAQGTIRGAVVTFLDISERKRAEAELRQLRDFYGSILDNIVTGVWVADADDRIFYANRGMAAIAGIPVERIAGTNVLEDFPESTLLHFRPLYLQAKRTGMATRYEEVEVITPAGRQSFQSGWLVPLGEAGALKGVICTVEDITERKRIEEVRRSEQEFRALAEHSPDAVVRLDRQLRYRYVNPAMAAVIGIERERFIGRTDRELGLPAELVAYWEQHLRRVFADGREGHTAFTFTGPRGERYYETRLVPEFGPDGEVQSVLGISRDLTARKQAEAALRASEERLALSQEVAGVGSFDWQVPKGRVVWSAGLERLYGLESGEYAGTYADWFGRVHPADQDAAEHSVQRAIALRQEWRVEFRIVRKDGTVRWMFALGRPLFDEAGQLVRFLGVNLDITERKQAELALEQREQAFRAIVEAWPDIVARYDRALRHLYVSPSIKTVTWLTPDEYIGKTNRDLGMPEENIRMWETFAGRVFSAGVPQEAAFSFTGPDGVRHDYEWRLVPEFGASGQVETVLAWARDVTARNEAEAAQRDAYGRLEQTLADLRATQAQLVRSEKLAAVGTLAGGVAHEINNPLMGVMGYVDHARSSSSEPTIRHLLDGANKGLERIRDLVKRLVDASTPLSWEQETLSLPTVLAQVLSAQQRDFDACGIAVEISIPTGLPPVQAPEEGLQQVFANLLSNARDALADSPDKRLSIRARREVQKVIIEVSDSGSGIRPEIQERIFDPFFTTKPPGRGTGLGLPIARNIVEALGGSIECQSEPGRGTTFTVELPASSTRERPVQQ